MKEWFLHGFFFGLGFWIGAWVVELLKTLVAFIAKRGT